MKKLIILSLTSILIMVSYQNCADVSLEKVPVIVNRANVIKPSGDICPGKAMAAGQEVRFLFIVDMSLSNLGGLDGGHGGEGGNWYLRLDAAADLPGDRFKAVKDFIDTCGMSEGASYSVIGFSDKALFGNSNTHLRGCEASYVTDRNVAKGFVNDLHAIQNGDIAKNGSFGYSSPFTMSTTSYRDAIICAETSVNVDLAMNPNPNAFYQIFFVTDGKPNEFNSNLASICGTDPTCLAMFSSCNPQSTNFNACVNNVLTQTYYPSKVASIAQRARLNGNNISFQPVYYGGNEEEYAVAKPILDRMAVMGNPEDETVRATNLNALAPQLCGLLTNEIEVPYIVNSMFMLNLTAKEHDGNWKIDSDMDGLVDIYEEELGLDPLNPRTKGILDAICEERHGESCRNIAAVTCGGDLGFLLKDCDAQALAMPNLTGLDSDRDGILDFIEIVYGTNPMISNLNGSDYDGDGKSDIEEIRWGTNPRQPSPFSYIKDRTKIKFSQHENNAICGGNLNGYSFELESFPHLESVKAYQQATLSTWDLRHADGENVYLLYYIASPNSTDPSLRKKIYGTIIKIHSSRTQPILIQQNNFNLIGEI